MKFQPKTESELASENLAPEGQYGYEVASATEEIGKTSGKPYIKLGLKIYGDDGRENRMFCNLSTGYERLLRNFCDSAGILAEYGRGELHPDMLIGLGGGCQVIIKTQPGFSPKNEVKDFVKRKDNVAKPASVAKSPTDPDDDGLPY